MIYEGENSNTQQNDKGSNYKEWIS